MTKEPRIYGGVDSLFNKWCWETGQPHAKEYLVPYTKINSKWIKGLNVQPETIKLLEENISSKLLDIGFGEDFFGFYTKRKGTKAEINKWDYIKL